MTAPYLARCCEDGQGSWGKGGPGRGARASARQGTHDASAIRASAIRASAIRASAIKASAIRASAIRARRGTHDVDDAIRAGGSRHDRAAVRLDCCCVTQRHLCHNLQGRRYAGRHAGDAAAAQACVTGGRYAGRRAGEAAAAQARVMPRLGCCSVA